MVSQSLEAERIQSSWFWWWELNPWTMEPHPSPFPISSLPKVHRSTLQIIHPCDKRESILPIPRYSTQRFRFTLVSNTTRKSLTPIQFKKTPVRRPPVEQKYGGSRLWIHGKADIGIVRAANKLWRREFCWKDIVKLRFTAYRLKNARSFAEQMLKGQVAAEQNGLPWNYRKINYCHQQEREGKLLKGGFLRLIP